MKDLKGYSNINNSLRVVTAQINSTKQSVLNTFAHLFFLLIILLTASLNLHAQFTVIGIEGNINKNGQTIKVGDQLNGESILDFKSDGNQLYLIDDSLGFHRAESFEGEIELGECLEDFNTKHRGFKRKPKAIKNLKIYFGPKQFTIIGDSLSIPLDIAKYPLNSEKFIVFHYKINGEQQSKKVAFDNQHLIIIKNDLFQGKTETMEGETLQRVNIYSFEPETKTSKKITQANFRFITKEQFHTECSTIFNVGKSKNIELEKIQTKIDQYIYGRYGMYDPKQLEENLSIVRQQN